MEVLVQHRDGVRFKASARQHMLICDQPVENRGSDAGMTPPELLLAALGTCAGYYAAQYLRQHRLATEGTRVRVVAEKVKPPARLDNFRVEITVPCSLGEQHRKGIAEAVHGCLIHNTLLHPPAISLDVTSEEPVG